MPWRAILDGLDADRARAVIAATVADLETAEIPDLTLNRGWAGIAVLHGQRARAGDPDAADRAHDAIARGLERLDAGATNPWLGVGYLGLAWAMEHLRDVLEFDDDALAPMDALAAGLLAHDPWPYEYELMAGLVGVGVYALERGRLDLAERTIAHLDRLAVRTPDGIAWWNRDPEDWKPPYQHPDGYHNVGIALGSSGVIGFLGAAIAAGVATPLVRDLLGEAIRWVLAQEQPDQRPRLPMCRYLEPNPAFRRNAWCYGDAATATVLARAAAATGEAAWADRARAIARAMAAGPVDDVPYLPVDFCCGLIGRAHLFDRLGQALADLVLLDTARAYYRRALDAYPSANLPPGLKSGRAGIAASLLSAITPLEPAWDRAFVVAVPPAE